jgi:FAD/FMN-containing dehydrogenase
LPAENGVVGNSMLTSMTNALDPDNLLNPGKLLV